MGGNSSSDPQSVGSQLSSMFQSNGGYQQPQGQPSAPPIQAPQYPSSISPSPADAAAATRARMGARAPVSAPTRATSPWDFFNQNQQPPMRR